MDSLRVNELTTWCDELGRIGAAFADLAKKQGETVGELRKYTEIGDAEELAAKKRKEIEELSVKNYKLWMEIGQAKLELDAVNEEHYRAVQQVEFLRNALPPYVDPNNEQQVAKYRRMVFCPICQVNRRDCILSGCGHVLCRACLEKCQKKECPICQKPFSEDTMKPFFLQ
jgi:hypothetical protein